MNRRNFLKQTSIASAALFAPKFVTAFDALNAFDYQGKKIVIIQLSGGNDGLNTVVPFRNDIYYKKRNTLAIEKANVLNLNNEVGFHKSLTALKSLYDNGELCIVNNVGYPNPNRSHFRATDIWQSGSDANQFLQTGWIGRYLDATKAKPYHAIEADDSLSMIFKGNDISGIATQNPRLLFKSVEEPYFKKVLSHHSDAHLSEHNLGYLYKTMVEAKSSATYIHETTRTFSTKVTYTKSKFSKQLKQIAQFINSGLESKVYYASFGGFDTHVNQINRQKKLLDAYNDAIASFVKDLKQQNTFKDTVIMTFSEFGRRVQQNAGNGTDHGTANQVFIIGENLKKKGFLNEVPDLTKLDANGDLLYDIDFREIYTSLLNNWLDIDANKVLHKSFKNLPIV